MKNYYNHLNRVQNQYAIIDILTITGLMDKADKLTHLLRYAELVDDEKAIEYHSSMVNRG